MKIKVLIFTFALVATLGFCAFPANAVNKDTVDKGEIRGLTAKQMASLMHAGVNIGNTMECPENFSQKSRYQHRLSQTAEYSKPLKPS